MEYCKVENCFDHVKVKGFCTRHYARDYHQRKKEHRAANPKPFEYDCRPFYEKFSESELREAINEMKKWKKERGHKPYLMQESEDAYKRRFPAPPRKEYLNDR